MTVYIVYYVFLHSHCESKNFCLLKFLNVIFKNRVLINNDNIDVMLTAFYSSIRMHDTYVRYF